MPELELEKLRNEFDRAVRIDVDYCVAIAAAGSKQAARWKKLGTRAVDSDDG